MSKSVLFTSLILSFFLLSNPVSGQAQVQNELARIEQDSARLATAVTSYVRSGQPAKFEVDTILRAYDTNVTHLLKAKRIGHTVLAVPESLKGFFKDVQFPIYQVLPDRQTALGRFSSEIQRRYDVDVVYAPALLKVTGSEALFFESSTRPFLVVSTDAAIIDSMSNSANRTEAVRLKFWAYRMGREPDFLPTAPVHISVQSNVDGLLNFERLVAATENLKAKAATVLDSKSSEDLLVLQHEVTEFKEMTEKMIAASNKALALLRNGQAWQKVSPPTKVAGQYYKLESSDFQMMIFLAASESNICGSQCGPMLALKLEKALALAGFNQQFLTQFSKAVPDEALLKMTLEFQKSQMEFIGSL